MKILLCADLHFNRSWYDWLVRESANYDLIAVAGDLLDMFVADPGGQIDFLRQNWLPAMIGTGVPVAISSGNHDGAAMIWLSYISCYASVVGDGATSVLTVRSGERMIVTTCPYYRSFDRDDAETIALWQAGARLRSSENVPWLVLHHEPLAALAEPKTITTHWLSTRLQDYGPDFVSSGHFHEGATTMFAHRVGRSWCFNPGQRIGAPTPNYIALDSGSHTATRVRMLPAASDLSWFEQRDVISLR